MDFSVTVRTINGAVKVLEVKNMPDESAARAEAIGLTFGQVLKVDRLDVPQVEKPVNRRRRVQEVERPLKPGETETIITGYNNNPAVLFSNIDIF